MPDEAQLPSSDRAVKESLLRRVRVLTVVCLGLSLTPAGFEAAAGERSDAAFQLLIFSPVWVPLLAALLLISVALALLISRRFPKQWAGNSPRKAAQQETKPEANGGAKAGSEPSQDSWKARQAQHQVKIDACEDRLKIARRAGDRHAEMKALADLGDISESTLAVRYHEKELTVARDIGDREGQTDALLRLARGHFYLKSTRQSLECAEQALQIAREMADLHKEASALKELSLIWRQIGQLSRTIPDDAPNDARAYFSRALEYSEQHLKLSRQTGDWRGEWDAWMHLGSVCCDLDDHGRDMECHRESLQIARTHGDARLEQHALEGLAAAYKSSSEYRLAIECLEKALPLLRASGQKGEELRTMNEVGSLYHKLEEYDLALECYERSLAAAREVASRFHEGFALRGMRLALEKLGRRC